MERLTFGAKPADLDHAAKIGLDRWIDEQLHPDRIPENPVLKYKIADLETLQLSATDLLRQYPSNASIALMATGALSLPKDPLLRRGVERAIERYRSKKDADDKSQAASDTPNENPKGEIVRILGAANARLLRNGTPEERNAMLDSLAPETLNQLLLALPPAALRGLAATGPAGIRRKAILVTAPQQVIAFDLNENRLQRAIYSTHQLEELLVDFWFNHFNVFLDKGADRHLVPSYERDAIRPYVLGKFRDMLRATAHHPAMLFYLDNWQSVAPREGMRMKRGLNENYARELMELHTLGVDGGYTQKDVTEVARCLTGWTIREPRRTAEFLYNDRVHDKGEKTVLGTKIPAGGGKEDGDRILDMLAAHPSTAKYISRKLAVRFVSDTPSEALVSQMAAVFQKSGGDLREVMRTMLRSKEFRSEAAFRAKVKTPFEMVASAARALDADVTSTAAMARELNQLGEPLYRKVEPTGYSWRNAEWINSSALLGRMNVALSMAQGKMPGVKPNLPADASREALEKLYIPAGLGESTKASISKALERKDGTPATIAGLLLGSPEFQRK
ncbi:hypothetical protein F183_A54350 [Bryobacterales bacterium F-183]|nr:hypothetical protein F183_A54350 [Bryobacterales bacterium F-183]